jgi:hypothetical protein
MKIGSVVVTAMMVTGLTGVCAVYPPALSAQTTGVSHPEEIPVTTSPEGVAQPLVYEGQTVSTTVVSAPALKQRTQAAEPIAYVPSDPPVAVAAAPIRLQPQNYPEPTVQPPPVRDLQAAVDSEPVAQSVPQQTSQGFIIPADPDAGIVTRVPGPGNEIPVGSMLRVRLLEKLSTGATLPGALFTAELEQSVERDGRILLPAGSIVRGKVTEVHGGRRISGTASIHLAPNSVVLPDGTTYQLRAQVIDTSLVHSQKVDDEGTILGSDHVKGTVAAFGLSTGAGAAAGAVLAGWPGAIIGAAAGAGVSTVVWLKQDHQTELPVGTSLTFGTTAPLLVGMQ